MAVRAAGELFSRFVGISATKLGARETLVPRLLLLAGIIACSAIALFVFQFRGTMGPDSGARFLLLRNLIAHHHIAFSGLTGDPSARELDAYAGYRAYAPGGAFVVYPVLFPAVTALLYSAFGDPGLVLIPIVAAGIAAWTVYRTAELLGLAGARIVPGLLLFGSPLLVYAATFWDHSTIIALSAVATVLVVRAYRDDARSRWMLVSAGAVCGAGLWMHELMLLLGISFGVALASDASMRRRAWPFVVGLVSMVVAWALSNQLIYGTLRGPHLLGPLDPADPFKLQQLISSHAFFARLLAELAGDTGALDVAFVALLLGTVILSFVSRRAAVWGALVTIALALVRLVDGYVANGFFQAMPWLVLALVGGDERGERRVFSTLRRAAVCFALLTTLTPITPGLNWGSRYLLTLLPAMTLLALRGFEEALATLGKERAAVAAPALVAFLAAGALVGVTREVRFYSNKASFDRSHARAVARLDRDMIATDLWWLPPEVFVYDETPRFSLVVNVPGSSQFVSPIPLAERTPHVQETFFTKLSAEHEPRFSFIGTESGRASLMAAATVRGYREIERTTERDLVMARFALASADAK